MSCEWLLYNSVVDHLRIYADDLCRLPLWSGFAHMIQFVNTYTYTHAHTHTHTHKQIHTQSPLKPRKDKLINSLSLSLPLSHTHKHKHSKKQTDKNTTIHVDDYINSHIFVCLFFCMFVFVCEREGERERESLWTNIQKYNYSCKTNEQKYNDSCVCFHCRVLVLWNKKSKQKSEDAADKRKTKMTKENCWHTLTLKT